MATTKELEARVASLEAQLAQITAALDQFPSALSTALTQQLGAVVQPLAVEIKRVDARVDHAGEVFKRLRRAVTPRQEPLSGYIPRDEFQAAIAELRDECGDETARFDLATIRERVHARRVLAANTQRAGETS